MLSPCSELVASNKFFEWQARFMLVAHALLSKQLKNFVPLDLKGSFPLSILAFTPVRHLFRSAMRHT